MGKDYKYMVAISVTHFIFTDGSSPEDAATKAMEEYQKYGDIAYDSYNDIVKVEYVDDGEGTMTLPDNSRNGEKGE